MCGHAHPAAAQCGAEEGVAHCQGCLLDALAPCTRAAELLPAVGLLQSCHSRNLPTHCRPAATALTLPPTPLSPCLPTTITLPQQYLQANLGPEQLKELEAAWARYQASTEAARLQRTSAAVQLQCAAALQSISWQKQSTQPSGGCTGERAQVGAGLGSNELVPMPHAQAKRAALLWRTALQCVLHALKTTAAPATSAAQQRMLHRLRLLWPDCASLQDHLVMPVCKPPPCGMQAYSAMAESTGCLSTLAHSEMGALVELQVNNQ